jgi:hypothetical protein
MKRPKMGRMANRRGADVKLGEHFRLVSARI